MIDDEITLKMHQIGDFLTDLAAVVTRDARPALKRAEPKLPDPPTYLLAIAEKYKFSPPRGNNASIRDRRLRGH